MRTLTTAAGALRSRTGAKRGRSGEAAGEAGLIEVALDDIGNLLRMDDLGPLCLACADLDQLAFPLPQSTWTGSTSAGRSHRDI